jgi:uncharacterized cupin superfamily protein
VSTSIVALDGRVEAEVSDLPAERLIAGTPELQVRNFFTDTSQQFFAGRWSASRGKWRVRYTENELCVMTAGRVTIESAASAAASGPGTRSWCPPALSARGKSWRTAPRSTRCSKHAAEARSARRYQT